MAWGSCETRAAPFAPERWLATFLALALASIVVLSPRAGVAQTSAPGCSTGTVSSVVTDLERRLGESTLRTVAGAVIMLGGSKAKAAVRGAEWALFSLDALETARSAAAMIQLFGADPDKPVELCPADNPILGRLGFERVYILAEPGVPRLFDDGRGLAPPSRELPPDPGPAPAPGWDDRTVLDIYRQLRTITPPSPQPPDENAMPPPASPPAAPPSGPTSTILGHVVDAETGEPVGQGTVSFAVAGPSGSTGLGAWQVIPVEADGSFFLELTPAKYVITVTGPIHQRQSQSVLVAPDGRDLAIEVPLVRRSPYPCTFTIVNRTDLVIDLFMGGPDGAIETLYPHSAADFTLRRFLVMEPAALLDDGRQVVWDPVPGDCEGPGLAYLD
jgi:hypothetical protein